jgi:hypothetical protein
MPPLWLRCALDVFGRAIPAAAEVARLSQQRQFLGKTIYILPVFSHVVSAAANLYFASIFSCCLGCCIFVFCHSFSVSICGSFDPTPEKKSMNKIATRLTGTDINI